MALEGLLDMMRERPAYESLLERLRSEDGRDVLEIAPAPGARPYLIAALARHLARPMLVIVPGPEDARRMHDQVLSYLENDAVVHLMPEPEALPYERVLPDAATSNDRLQILSAFAGAKPMAPACLPIASYKD